ncbi:MAG: hypothetical protein AB1715_10980 [Acidobacteriota bacterium]
MKTRPVSILFALGLLAFSFLALMPVAQEKANTGKILGTWKVEIYAGDTYYYLSLVVSETQGQLAGKISESMGSFTDVALEEIFFDGEIFRFNFTCPMPPDGVTRLVKAEFKVGVDTMSGIVSVPDLDITTDATATRESK